MRFSVLVLAGIGVAAAGCGGKSTPSATPASSGGNAVVFQGSELSGMLLQALRTRMPAMMVGQRGADGCPLIMFRGQHSARNQGSPSVYVDGTLMVDTCILQQLNAADVERVEIYPSGNAAGAAVRRNPSGVILVYRNER